MAMYGYVAVLTGIGLTSKMSTVGWPTLVIKVHMMASLVHAMVLHADVKHVQSLVMQQHAA